MKKCKELSFCHVNFSDGFWHDRQCINSEITIYAVYNRFVETGRIDAFKFDWKPGSPNKPHIFWESDVAKWIEAASYIYQKNHDTRLVEIIDEIVDQIEKNQLEDGYFNIYYTLIEPENKWQMRTGHELYCAGHLMEAAVAYFNATGKDKFLKLMCKYADHIEQVFVKEKSAGFITPGHEEIELALVRLFHATGERRYLELSRYFLDNRGKDDPSTYYSYANAKYSQDHAPVIMQETAEGHAVRAAYLYSAMADNAFEHEDEALFATCRKLFENIVTKRMYITGGIGSSGNGEAFTIDYDLPNLTAYNESCASIGLIMFAQRMLKMAPDSLYSDVVERVLYNSFLSSISLKGDSFFYENPLEVFPELIYRDTSVTEPKPYLPPPQRFEMFKCSCCPPNIARFIGSIGSLLYHYTDNTVFVHQYISSSACFNTDEGEIEITQKTKYPNEGDVVIQVKGMNKKTLALRIPGWCHRYSIRCDGKEICNAPVKGYLYVNCEVNDCTIELHFEMMPVLMEATPYVQEDARKVALQRGPIVYCLEEADNGKNLKDIAIDLNTDFTLSFDNFFGAYAIEADAYRRNPDCFTSLYRPLDIRNQTKQKIRFIPYFAFANRGENEMLVWLNYTDGNKQR